MLFFKKILSLIIAQILPRQCLICNKIIDNAHFCGEDFNRLEFISDLRCQICGDPFGFVVDENRICVGCLSNRAKFDKNISVFRYDDLSKKMIFNFKYGDKGFLAKFFARLMFNFSRELKGKFDFVVPVPMHKRKLRKRKFNQSVLIARDFSKLSKVEMIVDLLVRKKNTRAQFSLGKSVRNMNMKGAFAVNDKLVNKVLGKNILLIDDVITTGATINECCKVLRKIGVSKVYVVTLAKRVI